MLVVVVMAVVVSEERERREGRRRGWEGKRRNNAIGFQLNKAWNDTKASSCIQVLSTTLIGNLMYSSPLYRSESDRNSLIGTE